ncbi:CP family cyanate transporter-like MFS transporter OS=Castellaniella defragrans OX=75697 GN=HNR28_002849 PE=4 SV=1 [Castellaniella defragrans]
MRRAMPRFGTRRDAGLVLLLLAVLLAGLNMRAMLTAIGPVLDDIRTGLGLSPSAAGLLVALPTLYFGLFGLLAPRLLRIFSMRRLIVGSLVVVALGVGLRSGLGLFGMHAGLLLASAGISMGMVLVPAVIKNAFPRRIGLVTSLYTMSFCLGASLGAGLVVPMTHLPHSSWEWALAFWVLPALGAAAVWRAVPRAYLDIQGAAGEPIAPPKGLFRDPLAWQVTLYMGLQSCIGQSLIGWLPVILISRGLPAAEAGVVMSVTLLVQLVANLAAPWMAMRGRDQRAAITLMIWLAAIGTLAIFYAPLSWVWLWAVVLGLGMGGTFSIAVSLLVLRSRSSRDATALSGMAQGVGYTVASVGPVLVGMLYQFTGTWLTVAAMLSGLYVATWAVGLKAGRNGVVLAQAE